MRSYAVIYRPNASTYVRKSPRISAGAAAASDRSAAVSAATFVRETAIVFGTDCEIFAPSDRSTAQCPAEANPVPDVRDRDGLVEVVEDVLGGRERVDVPGAVEADGLAVVAGADVRFLLDPPHAVARTRTESVSSRARATIRSTPATARARR
jgi:hypothetical protein